MVIDKLSRNCLDWLEKSGQFLLTVDRTVVDDNIKMNSMKILVTGKAKAGTEGMGLYRAIYRVASQTLVRDIRRPEIVIKVQLKKMHSYIFIKPHDPSKIIKYSHIVSGCANVLPQIGYLASENVLNSSVRSFTNNLKAKQLIYLERYDSSFKTRCVFSAWRTKNAEFQGKLKMHFGTAQEKSSFGRDRQRTTTFTSDVQEKSNVSHTKWPLKDGDHKFWNCALFI